MTSPETGSCPEPKLLLHALKLLRPNSIVYFEPGEAAGVGDMPVVVADFTTNEPPRIETVQQGSDRLAAEYALARAAGAAEVSIELPDWKRNDPASLEVFNRYLETKDAVDGNPRDMFLQAAHTLLSAGDITVLDEPLLAPPPPQIELINGDSGASSSLTIDLPALITEHPELLVETREATRLTATDKKGERWVWLRLDAYLRQQADALGIDIKNSLCVLNMEEVAGSAITNYLDLKRSLFSESWFSNPVGEKAGHHTGYDSLSKLMGLQSHYRWVLAQQCANPDVALAGISPIIVPLEFSRLAPLEESFLVIKRGVEAKGRQLVFVTAGDNAALVSAQRVPQGVNYLELDPEAHLNAIDLAIHEDMRVAFHQARRLFDED